MQKQRKMKEDKKAIVALICIPLIAIAILSTPLLVDYYINHESDAFRKTDCRYNNCILKGKYNDTSIDLIIGSVRLDRQFQNSWLYKECKHGIGDDVKYFGQFHNGSFILRRELC